MTDITEHKWYDMQIVGSCDNQEEGDIQINTEDSLSVHFNKRDAIAIAKHFGLLDSLQARIDELMLEYCPNDMPDDQIQNWANHQMTETEILLSGANGTRLRESIAQLPRDVL